MSIINAFLSMFGMQPQVDMGAVMTGAFKQEHPSLEGKRNIARVCMESWGRKSLIEGGDYTRQNKVLRERQLSLF